MSLITGLANLQAVRTAYALDIAAIVICRGKALADPFVEIAGELGIPVLWTPLIMFETCGSCTRRDHRVCQGNSH
jgi:hypothetical protein